MKKIGVIAGVVIILLLIITGIVFGVIYHKVTQDNIKDKYTLTDPDDGITLTIVKGSLFGNEFEISEKQFNTYINKKFCTVSDGKNSGVDHIMVYFNDDGTCEMYGHAFHKGFSFAMNCKAKFSVDENTSSVRINVYDAYVGELHLSDSVLNDVLDRILSESTRVNYIGGGDANVEFKAEYNIEIPNTSGINIGVKEAYAKDGALMCRTNSLAGETLKAGIEYVTSKEGREAIAGLVDNAKNKIKDKIGGVLGDLFG